MSCGVVHRYGLDLMWLWHRLAAAALIGPLAWELPYAAGADLKKKKKKKKTKNKIKSVAPELRLPILLTWGYVSQRQRALRARAQGPPTDLKGRPRRRF